MSVFPFVRLRELTLDVQTWSPLRSDEDDEFDYIDLSAVSQELKAITEARKLRCAEAPSRARQLVKANDVLVSTVRPNLNGVALVTNEFDCATASTGFCVVRPNPERLNANYLFHWVKTDLFVNSMVMQATGASYPAVSDKIILESAIPLPDISEQRRIAAILDKADALRAKRREALAQLDRLAQSIFVEMFGDPATNPKDFPVRKLGDLIKFEGGAQPPASTFSDVGGDDKIRLVQIRDFKTDKFKTFIPRSLAKRFFESDDVMIGRYGPPVFQILRGLSGSYNVALMKAVPKDGVTKEFIFHLLQESRLHNFVVSNSERTAGQSGVNLDLLEAYDAYLPPIRLQLVFQDQMQALTKLKLQHEEAMIASSGLFEALQHRAFQGEL